MRNKLAVSFFILVFAFSFISFNFNVFGETLVKLPEANDLKLSNKSIKETIEDVSKWILRSIAVLAILMILVSGVWYIISGGDRDATQDATKMLIFAITGLVVALLGYALVIIIGDVLGAGSSNVNTIPNYTPTNPGVYAT